MGPETESCGRFVYEPSPGLAMENEGGVLSRSTTCTEYWRRTFSGRRSWSPLPVPSPAMATSLFVAETGTEARNADIFSWNCLRERIVAPFREIEPFSTLRIPAGTPLKSCSSGMGKAFVEEKLAAKGEFASETKDGRRIEQVWPSSTICTRKSARRSSMRTSMVFAGASSTCAVAAETFSSKSSSSSTARPFTRMVALSARADPSGLPL